ncbi:MAG: gluconate 2-dehydrogenase subunit 3 family protein [Polyangiaceae bacterium]
MSTPPIATLTTRRRFLGGAIVLLCGVPACDAGPDSGSGETTTDTHTATWTKLGAWEIPPDPTLSPARYAMLAALMDVIIPGDEGSPGATIARAAYYVDRLLGAFRSDPPLIFAGGPNSGRHGGVDDFSSFLRLTRVEEIRWRTFIEGSHGMPEREWNGPVKGLVDKYEEGLDAADKVARDQLGVGLADAPFDDRKHLLGSLDKDFVAMVYEHAVEGTYGDPVYGGNYQMAGWKAIDYEGDRQPIGFSAHEMAHPEEG